MGLSRGSQVFLAIAVLAVAGVLGGLYALNAGGSGAEPGIPVIVEIDEGMGLGEVADALAEAGVVDNALEFRVQAQLDGRGTRVRPGSYELETGMELDPILEVLTAAPMSVARPTFRVTVPEGLTVPATLERIAEAEGSPFTVEELEQALVGVALPEWVPIDELPEGAQVLEGLLFPATYEFFADEDPQTVLARLMAQTSSELDRIEVPSHLSRYEVLIVASIIEREVKLADERPVVSAVIRNRLDAGMRLQVDATVQYARGEHTGRLLFDDLQIDSAWNTYESDGLPPTPIAAPGRAAIEAAANPADTDFLFYVVCDTETGEHVFAESNDAHQRNVVQYRSIQETGGSFCEA